MAVQLSIKVFIGDVAGQGLEQQSAVRNVESMSLQVMPWAIHTIGKTVMYFWSYADRP